jgi:hypothetical protein
MSMCLRDVVAEDGETVLTNFILEPKHKVQPCNRAHNHATMHAHPVKQLRRGGHKARREQHVYRATAPAACGRAWMSSFRCTVESWED